MKRLFLLFNVTLLLFSCKLRFTEKEIELLNPYEVGDTLYFQNQKNDIDTFRIFKKDVYHTNWTPLERDGWYNPPNAKVWYRTVPTFDSVRKEDPEIIWLTKHSPDSPLKIRIYFKYFLGEYYDNLGVLQSDTLKLIDGNWIPKYYKLEPLSIDWVRDSTDVRNIFWNNEYGIVRYTYKNGEIWDRIKLKK